MVGEDDTGSREREVVRRDLRRQVVGAQPVPDEDDHAPLGRCVRPLRAQVAGERQQHDGEGNEENKRSRFHGSPPMTPAMTVRHLRNPLLPARGLIQLGRRLRQSLQSSHPRGFRGRYARDTAGSHMLAYKDLTRRRDTETRLCVKRTFRALNAYYASDPRARLTGG